MVENESDQESVESGSCTCSDYDPDSSWFYDSRNLQTSYMRFCIIKEDDPEPEPNIENNKKSKNEDDENNNNELQNASKIRSLYKRNNAIKLSKSSKKTNPFVDQNNNNKSKYKENIKNNIIKYQTKAKNDNLSYTGNIDYKNNNLSNRQKQNSVKNHNKKMFANVYDLESNNNLFYDSSKKYEQIKTEPLEEEEIDDYKETEELKSPVNISNRKIKFYNNYATEHKFEDTIRKLKGYSGPRMIETYNLKDDDDDEKIMGNIDNKNNSKNISKRNNNQTRGRTIKERVVKEIKNITIQPGQTIKHRTVTKRKLKPITTIVNNNDGTQNIVTENTILTTITINENLDSSKMYDDKYPLDVQLVKQYITKIYKTETEINPYRPKK